MKICLNAKTHQSKEFLDRLLMEDDDVAIALGAARLCKERTSSTQKAGRSSGHFFSVAEVKIALQSHFHAITGEVTKQHADHECLNGVRDGCFALCRLDPLSALFRRHVLAIDSHVVDAHDPSVGWWKSLYKKRQMKLGDQNDFK